MLKQNKFLMRTILIAITLLISINMANPQHLIPTTLAFEGGYVCDPTDSGGHTNSGITLSTYRLHFGKDKTVEHLRNMTYDEWYHIYYNGYWKVCKGDEIKSQAIADIVVDWYFNSGTWGIKKVQEVLGVTVDGIFGPKTLAAINEHPDQKELFHKIKDKREAYYRSIAKGTKAKYLRGWLRRNDAFEWFE